MRQSVVSRIIARSTVTKATATVTNVCRSFGEVGCSDARAGVIQRIAPALDAAAKKSRR